jgi:hypothetical protein
VAGGGELAFSVAMSAVEREKSDEVVNGVLAAHAHVRAHAKGQEILAVLHILLAVRPAG